MNLKAASHSSAAAAKPAPQSAAQLRWWALVVLALAQFLVVLDASIVNIALPSLGSDLNLNSELLSWVITAYVLPFGGFLLLGGRLGDRYGHRLLFLSGVAGFTLASAAAGLAQSGAWLLAARAFQGASAALLAPAALALVARLFPDPRDRAKALGIWGAVAGIGSAAGVLLGGVLTSAFGWSAVFYVNVPIGLLVVLTLPSLVSRDRRGERNALDMPGAVTITAALVALVAALARIERSGWTSPVTLALAGVSAAALAAFLLIERRASQPLLPFSIFRNKSVLGGNLAMFLIGGATTGLFFALSVYMQQVLLYGAMKAGLTQLPLAGALVLVAGVIPAIVSKLGTRLTLAVSLFVLAGGLVWLAQAPSEATFAGNLLLPSIAIGLGLGGAFVVGTDLAVHGVSEKEAGLASGLVNTGQQVGGAVGLAILTTAASMRTTNLLGEGASEANALTGGFQWVFLGAAILSALAGILVLLIVRSSQGKGR
ncbi:MFS transporter [Cohnella thailandensis]|uniref:MFS transporter n=1 Tax=Cohnella thailandensis TaxID=557557 RepID=A0A841SQZ8_9BACL|nr:MFS transporter [Cohnella thailandensis]MBB6633036.1 MFS transporter [Cohnella thailandensis]MBP1975269.1 EmrB/QacA subfamily drug resistance transporter [Cohnella thailandensis]